MGIDLARKHYQQQTQTAMQEFLRHWRAGEHPAGAFRAVTGTDYVTPDWEERDLDGVPALTLKAATGAGKTLMMTDWLVSMADHPERPRIVIWLVPTQTLVEQTIRVLRDAHGPYRPALASAYGEVTVMRRETMFALTAERLAEGLVVCVSTAAGFRRDDREGLRAYRPNATLAPLVAGANGEILLVDEETGRPASSLVNALRVEQPVIVIDESHRHASALSWRSLADMRPRMVLGMTATTRGTVNVLAEVSPLALKQEEMIRLPVNLVASAGWLDCLADGTRRRTELETEANRAGESVRPILLVQAEAKDHEASKLEDGKIAVYDVVHALVGELGFTREQVAVRVSGVDELSGVDLLDVHCPVRAVVTVEAAAEGWDCPYAMVLCALSAAKSHLKVEQLLGRCLRQAGGRRSVSAALNETYVYSATTSFAKTADAVIAAMKSHGFAAEDVRITGPGVSQASRTLDAELRDEFSGLVIPALVLNGAPLRDAAQLEPWAHDTLDVTALTGLERPQRAEGAVRVDLDAEGRATSTRVATPGGQRDEYTEFTPEAVTSILARRVRRRDVPHARSATLVRATVAALVAEGWSTGELFAALPDLIPALTVALNARQGARLWAAYTQAHAAGALGAAGQSLPPLVAHADDGSAFTRHAYSIVAPMNGEERALAERIDAHDNTLAWWRNPERVGVGIIGPWGVAYPDFWVWTRDGRLLGAEYKGEQLTGNADTERKRELGLLWAAVSGETFCLVTKVPSEEGELTPDAFAALLAAP